MAARIEIDGVPVVDIREEKVGSSNVIEVLMMENGDENFQCVEPGCERVFENRPKIYAHLKMHSVRVSKTVAALTVGELVDAYDRLRSVSSEMNQWPQGDMEDPEQKIVDLTIAHSEELARLRREHAVQVRQARAEGRKAGEKASRDKIAQLRAEKNELAKTVQGMKRQAAKLAALMGGQG